MNDEKLTGELAMTSFKKCEALSLTTSSAKSYLDITCSYKNLAMDCASTREEKKK